MGQKRFTNTGFVRRYETPRINCQGLITRAQSLGQRMRCDLVASLLHGPDVLFLDEPTIGLDATSKFAVRDFVKRLNQDFEVTVILTTHYIEEAEEMADRIGVINKGKLIVTEDKNILMKTLGKKELVVYLDSPLAAIPEALSAFDLQLANNGAELVLTYDPTRAKNGVVDLMEGLKAESIRCTDVDTRQSSLEEIFVKLIGES